MLRLGALAPFRIRSYRFQWPADLLTSWAFEMETLILGWYVLVTTNSVLMLTMFGALLYGGTLIAPIVGRVERPRRSPQHAVGDARDLCAGRGDADGAGFTGTLRPTVVLVLAAVTGIVRPSDMGLRGALIADTMPAETLTAAMGIARTTSDSARIAGALTGAGDVRRHRHRAELCGDHGVLCAGRGPDLQRVQPPKPRRGGRRRQARRAEQPSPWGELREGLVMVWNTPRLLAIVWYALPVQFRGVSL